MISKVYARVDVDGRKYKINGQEVGLLYHAMRKQVQQQCMGPPYFY